MAAERVDDLGKNKLRKLLMNTVMINSAIKFSPTEQFTRPKYNNNI